MRISFYFANISARSAIGLIVSAMVRLVRTTYSETSHRHKHTFENEARATIGISHAIAVPANRSGLFALLTALNVGLSDEVIVTGFTCSAVSGPILQHGAVPVYVDIDPGSFCLDPNLLLSALTPRSRVIILQHTYGFAGPIEEVMDIARRNGVFVIEDCALAFGSKKDGRWLGTFGDAAVWSFELSKTLSVGWGGLVGIRHDANLANRVREITEGAGFQGRWLAACRLLQGGLSGLLYHHQAPYLFRRYGLAALFKFRIFRSSADTPASDLRLPSDRQWKFLLQQLRRLDTVLARGKDAQQAYEAVLADHGCKSESMRPCRAESSLIRFPILVRDPQRFVDFFAAKDIEAGRWFSSPVSSGGVSPTKFGYVLASCPVAERVCAHVVNLPLHGRLTKPLIGLVAATLRDFLRAFPEEVEFIQGDIACKSLISDAQ